MKHQDMWESVRTLMQFRNQAPPLKPSESDDPAPLSFAQERLWLLEQLNPGMAAYNIPYAIRLQGKLNHTALECSLTEICRRHEILRTIFQEIENSSAQVVLPLSALDLSIVDLSPISEEDKLSKAQYLITEEANRPFQFSEGGLFRASLLKLSELDHILLLTFHHIVFDAYSDIILFKELQSLYKAFCQSEASPLKDLTIQYSDFSIWQRQWIQGDFLNTLLKYWQENLENLPEQFLPVDYSLSKQVKSQENRQTLTLSKSLVQQINALAAQEKVTLFITLLAAFKTLLSFYLQQDDLFVCTPNANRNRNEIQKQLGYFSNLLIQRTDLSGNPTFKEILARVRKSSSGAYAHQDLPIQFLVSELDLVNAPLSQIMFGLDDFVERPQHLGDLKMTFLEEQRGTEFDWFISIQQEAGSLKVVWKYNNTLFESTTISRLLDHFKMVLESVATDPEQPLDRLLRLSASDQKAISSKLEFQKKQYREYHKTSKSEAYIAPRNETELKLTSIWENILGVDQVGIRDNFFNLGGKSLLAIRLFAQIEDEFSCKLPVSTLVNAPTVEQLSGLLTQEHPVTTEWNPVVVLQSQGSKPPLFFLPPAACTALHYAEVAPYFAPDHPVYGLEQLGMDGQQAPHTSVEEMATYYIEKIQKIQPQGPYFLVGRCMGGIVAFEMALQLQTQGQTIGLLAILDTQSPPRLEPRNLKYYLQELGPRLKYFLSRKEFLIELIQSKITSLQNKVVPANPQDRYIQKVMDTHTKARKKYIPKRLYQGRFDLFKNDEASMDVQEKWAQLATDKFSSHTIPGDHKTMLEEPHVGLFIDKLKSLLS